MERLTFYFYIFFQGILFFQGIIFFYIYFTLKQKEFLYYALFLFLICINFLISDTGTFGLGDDDVVLNSVWYKLVNTPLVITANIFYVLFLKRFYQPLTNNRLFFGILNTVFKVLLAALILFFILFVLGIHSNFLFNIINLLGVLTGVWLVIIIIRQQMPFTKLMAAGFIVNLAGTCVTVVMLGLMAKGVKHFFVSEYPLVFIKLGLMGELLFFNMAIFKKWQNQAQKLAVQQIQTELDMEKLRNKISGALHDDIGSTLSGINMYTHMAMQQSNTGNQQAVKKSIITIQESAGEMINKLKEILWTVQPGKDNISSLTDKIEEYAIFMANAKEMQVKTIFESEVTDNYYISSQTRQHLFLIAKETINNAVKYSGASTIFISAATVGKLFCLTINDDGKGFDAETIKHGNGLNNMQKRANELGADFNIQSKMGQGCLASLKLKITQ